MATNRPTNRPFGALGGVNDDGVVCDDWWRGLRRFRRRGALTDGWGIKKAIRGGMAFYGEGMGSEDYLDGGSAGGDDGGAGEG